MYSEKSEGIPSIAVKYAKLLIQAMMLFLDALTRLFKQCLIVLRRITQIMPRSSVKKGGKLHTERI